MRLLNGKELAEFIKERQARQVRALRQAEHIVPHLAIVRANADPIVDKYMRLKKEYGADILVDVTIHEVQQRDILDVLARLNTDTTVHGIIVQLPLPEIAQTTEVLNTVSSHKDVDGLGEQAEFDSATPMAINWLLAGYNIELRGKQIAIVGQGRLVGKPLAAMWRGSDLQVTTFDRSTKDLETALRDKDIIVSATGKPGLITSAMVKPGAIVVDAGVATDKNGLTGDVADDVRDRDDITMTPAKGGVGPLTVCALFDNVIRAARSSTTQ